MHLRGNQPLAAWWFTALLLLTGCGGAETGCGSLDSRASVVRIISDDSSNALVNYAVGNSNSVAAMVSNAHTEAEKLAVLQNARKAAVYRLDNTIVTNSRNRTTGAYTCSGLLYVTVGDTTAEKQVDFRIDRATDGKTFISVNPFLF